MVGKIIESPYGDMTTQTGLRPAQSERIG